EQRGRRHPAQALELVDQVGLIEISGGHREVRQVDHVLLMHIPQCGLKTLHTAEDLRRQPDHAGEAVDEPPRAAPDLSADLGYPLPQQKVCEKCGLESRSSWPKKQRAILPFGTFPIRRSGPGAIAPGSS